MDVHTSIINQIIHQQANIIGPIAVDQARKVGGLSISPSGEINIQGNFKDVLGKLVEQYEQLFGRASVEVCKDALKEIKPTPSPDELPDILK